MDDDKQAESSKQAPRKFWSVFNVLLMAVTSGGALTASKLYTEFTEQTPLYDKFQTKSEAALLNENLKMIYSSTVSIGKEVTELRMYLDQRRAIRDREYFLLQSQITNHDLEISSLKLLKKDKSEN